MLARSDVSATFGNRLRDRLESAGVSISAPVIDQFGRYYALLQRWNARMNLTALPLADYPAQTLDRLLVEPVVASACLESTAEHWVDLGSGGGSPALPLKILRPDLNLTMVEARERKCSFLREAVRQLGLERAATICTRFEDLDGLVPEQSVDIVTLRAVRVDHMLAGLLDRLLATRGKVLLFGAAEAVIPGFVDTLQVVLPGGSSLRISVRRP
jgi:16S rRNA (guanine527-N7)-methyltransferase